MMEQILKNNITDYARSNVEYMLEHPDTITVDKDGRMCLMFIHDSVRIMEREIWLIFAAPVAMAVYLGNYKCIRTLQDAGYGYDPTNRFQAYNVEGNFDEIMREPGMVDINDSSYKTIRYNDFSNIQFITCMVDVPLWILDGVWKELNDSKEDVCFEDIFFNMIRYDLYSAKLVKDNLDKSFYTDLTTKPFCSPRNNIVFLDQYIKVLQIIESQLRKISDGEYPYINSVSLHDCYCN